MRKMKMMVAGLALVSVATLVGCKKDGSTNQGTNVKMMLTDAPGDFDAVYIDVEAIRVHTDAQGWVTYNSNLGVINILDYTNGEATLLADIDLEANAHVNQIRLVLGSNNSVVVDGETHVLSTPSAMQSGLKLNLNHTFSGGGDYTWTLDFDAAQSIVINGGSDYQLRPVIRLIVDNETAIALSGNGNGGGSGSANIDFDNDGVIDIDNNEQTGTIINGSITGNISGSISNIGGLAIVTATQVSGSGSGNGSSNVTVSTVTALSGNFNLSAMHTGSYTITIDPLIPLLGNRTMENVTVTAGQTTNVGLVTM